MVRTERRNKKILDYSWGLQNPTLGNVKRNRQN